MNRLGMKMRLRERERESGLESKIENQGPC